jgi:hypothetical protein
VHGFVGEGDGNFHAREVLHTSGLRRSKCAVLAAYFVVVGQGPQLDAVGFGASGQLLRCERAIRDHGVAMQVGVEYV